MKAHKVFELINKLTLELYGDSLSDSDKEVMLNSGDHRTPFRVLRELQRIKKEERALSSASIA
jgi:hypothetical protein